MRGPGFQTPSDGELHKAIAKKDAEAVESFLLCGADPDEVNEADWSALCVAVYRGYIDIVRVLIREGADINKVSMAFTPLMEAAFKGFKEIVQMLIEAGADVNVVNEQGKTALMLLAARGDIENIRLLISKGADISIRTKVDGESAQDMAQRNNHHATVRLLKKAATKAQAEKALREAEAKSHAASSRSQQISVAGASSYIVKRRAQP